MVARAMTYEDKLALRLSRDMGVSLSAEEYEATTGLDHDEQQLSDKKVAPITNSKGVIDMTTLLVDLLALLGVKVDASNGDKNFKSALYAATLNKIRELTGNTNANNTNDGNANNASGKTTKAQNPLLTGQIPQGDSKMEPMYFSLSNIENMTCPHAKAVALSLACERQSLPQRMHETNVAANRQRETRINEAYGKRQVIIDRIMRQNSSPHVRHQIDKLLNGASAAFSTDSSGQVVDPALASLLRLEQQLTAALRESSSMVITSPSQSETDDAVEALSRYFR